jgi:hypothetical protein
MTTSPNTSGRIIAFHDGCQVIIGRASVGKTRLLELVEAQQSAQIESLGTPIAFRLPPKGRSEGEGR